MQLDTSDDSISLRAHALTRDLPRDQALGLRLMALARAAAASHMAQAALAAGSAHFDHPAHEPVDLRQVLRSQASGLLGKGTP